MRWRCSLWLVLSATAWPAVAPAQEEPACGALLYHAEPPRGAREVRSLRFRGAPGAPNCHENDVLLTVQQQACQVKADLVILRDTTEHRTSEGVCYWADATFYVVEQPPAPVVDTVPRHFERAVLEMGIAGDLGWTTGGAQREPPLEPAAASVSRLGLGLEARFLYGLFGVELGFDPLRRSRANNPGYWELSLYSEQIARLGAVATVARIGTGFTSLRVDVTAGFNWTRLTLHDDFRQVLAVEADDQSATGFGHFARADVRLVSGKGLLVGCGLKYERTKPRFSGAGEALDAHIVELILSLGYRHLWW
jgi:hypothetical protein